MMLAEVNYRRLEGDGLLVGSKYRRFGPVDCIARAQRLTTPARDIHGAVVIGVHAIPAGFTNEPMLTTRTDFTVHIVEFKQGIALREALRTMRNP